MERRARRDDPELDPRLPAVYDAENRWAADDGFFLSLVNRRPASRVVDLGCGTGRLTTAIAAAGHDVVGVDPNRASLEAARAKPHGERVSWVEGTSSCLGEGRVEAAIMTSHVAQVFVSDDEWAAVLGDLRRALVPGGILAFDTRDPRARAWERWVRAETHGHVDLPDGRRVEVWLELVGIEDGVVSFTWHNVFPDGDRVEGVGTLRFRSEDLVRSTLAEAGFTAVDVFGGWNREPVGPDTGELVVVAHA